MNRIVRENYPVADLPKDLRKEQEPRPDKDATRSRRLLLEELYAQARPSFASLDEIADHIRSVRQEWD